jgi:hypothetical protein
MPNPTIAESSFSHMINAPIERVDIADWVLHLPNAESRRCCPPAHIACGATTTDDGTPMSTNVELIGENLMIQQYIGEITDPHHCRMVSTSDVFTPAGRTNTSAAAHLRMSPAARPQTTGGAESHRGPEGRSRRGSHVRRGQTRCFRRRTGSPDMGR